MAYRVQIELDERAPLKDKVLLQAKFLRHFQRRRMNADARGRTNWTMEYVSDSGKFSIIWSRQPGTVDGLIRFHRERLMGWVLLRFSPQDIARGNGFIVVGDWESIEKMGKKERVA